MRRPFRPAALSVLLAAAALADTGLVERIHAAGWRTYRHERVAGQNLLLSPPGIAILFDFAALGAAGATRDELQAAGFAGGPDPAWPALRGSLVEAARTNRVVLRSQAVFAHVAACQPEAATLSRARDMFNLEMLTAPELVAGWPARMERLFGAGQVWHAPPALHSLTAAWLIHFIHFRGRWAKPFPPLATREARFHISPTNSIPVDLMEVKDSFLLKTFSWGRAVALPHGRGDFRMVVVLPRREVTLEQVEDRLQAGQLAGLMDGAQAVDLRLRLPRFAFQADTDLRPAAEAAGIRRAFDPMGAEFQSLLRCPDNVYVAQVRQAARITVNEEGTRADAISGEEFVTLGEPDYQPFTCDRPFLFLIQERKSGLLLFIGRLAHPGA